MRRMSRPSRTLIRTGTGDSCIGICTIRISITGTRTKAATSRLHSVRRQARPAGLDGLWDVQLWVSSVASRHHR
ncbi:hypothetical protein FRZ44_00080 [Hypericibacter terrae]|uniref:Uncharacterized protein n=1 Tax=Hypericibacter terrae TaxID=2602015 RepID=A0A5J6MC03_9PROT|nr:hypothetical protein FRZ44_00080 [Hypericibacter terrae]